MACPYNGGIWPDVFRGMIAGLQGWRDMARGDSWYDCGFSGFVGYGPM